MDFKFNLLKCAINKNPPIDIVEDKVGQGLRIFENIQPPKISQLHANTELKLNIIEY